MTPLNLARTAIAAALLAAATGARADAAMPSACSLLPLANVRAIIGAPVNVIHDQVPVMARDGLEATNCLYMISLRGGPAASVWLGRGPAAHLAASEQALDKRPLHHGAHGIHGNTLAIVTVTTSSGQGLTYHDETSAKLLSAVLSKL